MLAHAKAVEAFRLSRYNDGKIGIILNLSPVYPKSDSPEDIEAAKWADRIYIRSFLDCAVKGFFSDEFVQKLKCSDLSPETKEGDRAIFKNNTVDFIGCNYYQPMRVQAASTKQNTERINSPHNLFQGYDWPRKKVNPHRGWEIYPRGIYDIAMRLKNDYGEIPWYISENGMGVSQEECFENEAGIIQDDYRIDFIKDHLEELHRAISEGANCFGYHLWTFSDCWSWLNAFKNRYGFYRVDLEKRFKRIPKKSSTWMAEVIRQNGFEN